MTSQIRDWGLSLAITIVAVLVTLGLVRYFAPGLLGIQQDLQLVQVDKKVPPFFEGALRSEDWANPNFILQDPLTKVRAKPFAKNQGAAGPNDLLGFRNRSIPNHADIVTIGDSQTYGNNAPIDQNWPNQLSDLANKYDANIYSMATGGWGPIQYYYAFQKALFFRPRIIIIAFYTGNDAFDAFQMAYGNPEWADFKIDPQLTSNDLPSIAFPPPESEMLKAQLPNNASIILTPNYRYLCNQNHPAINTGYKIMAAVAERLGKLGQEEGITVITTLIPTKEYVYRHTVDETTQKNPAYQALLKAEEQRLKDFESTVAPMPGITYAPVSTALSEATKASKAALYPDGPDGHPLASGYATIANALNPHLESAITSTYSGLLAIRGEGKPAQILLAHNNRYLPVADLAVLRQAGWPYTEIPVWHQLPPSFIKHGEITADTISHLSPAEYKKYLSSPTP